MTVPVSALQDIAPGAIIELFELQLNVAQHGVDDIYRFHAGSNMNNNGEIVWNGNSYTRLPVEAEGFEYSGKGVLPRPTIRCSNILSTITAVLATLPNGLDGAKVTRIRTLARYLDSANFPDGINPYGIPDGTAEFPREIFYVDRKVVETRDIVEFELCSAFDLAGVRAPKRQCIGNICQWAYRSAECGYAGTAYFDEDDVSVNSSTLDVCGKRLNSCNLRFGEQSQAGSVTVGSTQLVIAAAFTPNPGDPVSGFGVPSGTTVVSVSGNNVTMSAVATATSSVTKTGTLQSNRTQIVLGNVTGLQPRMLVTGPNIGAGKSIASIVGNTITLNDAVSFWSLATLATTKSTSLLGRTGTWSYGPKGVVIFSAPAKTASTTANIASTTGVSVGMFVTGPTIPQSANATVSSINASTIYNPGYLSFSYAGQTQGSSGTYSFYSVPAQSSQTYTFTVPSNKYIFRSGAPVNFGSFPGIGTYFS